MPKNHRRTTFKKKFHKKPYSSSHAAPREYRHKEQLQETDVGITEYISTLDGFGGIIKARFSDFQVNEIDQNGVVCKLTDTSIPKDFSKKEEKIAEPPEKSPLAHIPQEQWVEIRALLTGEDVSKSVELNADNLSKSERCEVHNMMKKIFGTKLYVNTKSSEDGKKIMEMKKGTNKETDKRHSWPQDKPEYVHFVLYKESLDTLEACLKIGECIKIAPCNLNYAGVKDRRAKTSQWMSVRKVEPWKLVIKTKKLTNIRIGNICFKDKPLKLGQLNGNLFRIALRNVTGDHNLIEKSMESLKNNGFINYYGLQRFGNDKETPTFEIGNQLLLGNWKKACEIILKPTKSDDPDMDLTKAKRIYQETEDPKKALGALSNDGSKSVEHLLLLGLSKGHKNEYVNALESIPRNMRLLYLHSFQSLIWNLAASRRIKQYGLKPTKGDLVAVESDFESEEAEAEDFEEPKRHATVKCLTEEDCENYSMYDIVLPLPGFDIVYPENMKDFYKETLESYGVTLEMSKQKVASYSLSGTYRKLFQPVKDLSWKTMHYNDPNYNLIRSDLEVLKKFEEPTSVEGGKFKALILQLSLHSASYATMVLREVLKTDTSSSSHAKLNNYSAETTKTIETPSCEQVDNDNNFNEPKGLLGDAEKYEAFKKLVFNSEDRDSPPNKRKLDDNEDNSSGNKIIKMDN